MSHTLGMQLSSRMLAQHAQRSGFYPNPFPNWTKWHRTIIPALGKGGIRRSRSVRIPSEFKAKQGGQKTLSQNNNKTNKKTGWGVVQWVVRLPNRLKPRVHSQHCINQVWWSVQVTQEEIQGYPQLPSNTGEFEALPSPLPPPKKKITLKEVLGNRQAKKQRSTYGTFMSVISRSSKSGKQNSLGSPFRTFAPGSLDTRACTRKCPQPHLQWIWLADRK